ncbi:lactonase family protein, partial [bacterium]|nr:lactonase family protein [bacterium]
MAYHVYISNAGSQFFSHFLMDEESGALAAQPDIQLPGSPGAVATNPEGTKLWVALRSAGILASYAVDRGSGQLSAIGQVSQEEGPPYLATDNTVSYLLSSYYGGGTVAVHRINDDGTLSDGPIQTLDTDGHAHSIQSDRSNRFA